MKKLSIEKDNGKLIIFLDAFTCVPGVGPDSDMDGHDLSNLTYMEKQRRDTFIEAFNKNYADVAEDAIFKGIIPVIRVKAFYDKNIFGKDDEEPENIDDEEKLIDMILNLWDEMFNLTKDEQEKFLAEYKKKINKGVKYVL